MTFPLSVLDLSPVASGSSDAQALRNTLDLARLADRLGYVRYWLAEHHNIPSVASTAPEIMIAHVAMVTSRMRVGSGGIMLPNHAPLRIAESFRVLEALHPGRIDLGVGRAPGSDSITALALRRSREKLGAYDFPEQLEELISFGLGRFPERHPFASIQAIPKDVPLPPIWILGSTEESQRLAASLELVMRLLNNSDSFIFAKGCLPGSLDLSQDLLSFSPPDVPLGFEVMPGEVLHDGIDQLAHAAEAAGQDRLLAQVSEEAFDQIHPG